MDLTFDDELYKKCVGIARFMEMTPEEFIEFCVERFLEDVEVSPDQFLAFHFGPKELLEKIFTPK